MDGIRYIQSGPYSVEETLNTHVPQHTIHTSLHPPSTLHSPGAASSAGKLHRLGSRNLLHMSVARLKWSYRGESCPALARPVRLCGLLPGGLRRLSAVDVAAVLLGASFLTASYLSSSR